MCYVLVAEIPPSHLRIRTIVLARIAYNMSSRYICQHSYSVHAESNFLGLERKSLFLICWYDSLLLGLVVLPFARAQRSDLPGA